MTDTLMKRALEEVSSDEFSALKSKARLEAFSFAYCRTLAEASAEELAAEASAVGVPTEQLIHLREMVGAERAKILAETLRLFGNRDQSIAGASEIDRLLDEVMGTSGFQGTIPG